MDEREFWYECPECGFISDSESFRCTPHWQDTPTELYLTLKEVVERVWPDWRKIWTGQPSRVIALWQERVKALARQEQELKAVPA